MNRLLSTRRPRVSRGRVVPGSVWVMVDGAVLRPSRPRPTRWRPRQSSHGHHGGKSALGCRAALGKGLCEHVAATARRVVSRGMVNIQHPRVRERRGIKARSFLSLAVEPEADGVLGLVWIRVVHPSSASWLADRECRPFNFAEPMRVRPHQLPTSSTTRRHPTEPISSLGSLNWRALHGHST
jgi:hypothetical protein